MHLDEQEEKLLRAVAVQNAKAVLVARERAERELVDANQRIANILETITDGFVALDNEWRFIFINQRAEEIYRPLHKTRSMLLGRSHWEVFADTVGTPLEDHFRRAVQDRVTVHFENYYAPLQAWFEVRAYPSPEGLSIYFQDISERKKAGEALLNSEQQLRAVFNQAAVGIALTGLDGRFAHVNRKFCEILGYSSEELQRMKPVDLTHPDDVPRTRDLMQQLVTGMLPHYAIEKRYLHKDGREIWGLSTVTLIKDALGRPERLIGIIEDITGRKQAEQQLKGSNDRLNLALMAGGLGDWEWDLATDWVLIGERTAEIFGIPHQPITWADLRNLLHEDDREHARLAVERALAERTDYNTEYRVVHPSGKVVWVTARGRGKYAANGKVLGMSGVVADVTERKLAEEARSQLAAVVESSDDAIISMDFDARVTTWNKGAERTFGYTAEEMVGKPITRLIPPARENEEPALLRRLKGGERIEHYETERITKDGRILHVSLSVSPVFDAKGTVVGVSKISRDITARKQTEEQLRRSEEGLRAMANSIPQLAWMARPDGEIFWYNQQWYEYTGTNLEQMRGWGWQSLHDPELLPAVTERWKHSLATGEPFDMEFPLRGADGVFRWFLTRVNPVRDGNGRVTRWFGTNTDVDSVRKAQEALREETRMLELLNDTGKAIASQLELQTLVQIVTDAATRLCGAKFGAFFYNVIDAQGEALVLFTLSGAPREAFEKFGHPRATPLFGPTFRGEGVIRSGDILKDSRYGQVPPHHGMPQGHLPVRSYLAVPVISRSGEVIGGLFFGHPDTDMFNERIERLIVGIAAQAAVAIDNARLYESAQREIRERQRVADELRQAQETLSHHAEELEKQVDARTASLREAIAQLEEFSYSVSHDLRAPLRAIAGYTELFKNDFSKDLPAPAHHFLDKIARSTERMQRLVNDVLTMSLVARSETTLHPVALQQFIEEIVEQHPEMQSPRATISIATPHIVLADEAPLGQAVRNLLANAVKFVAPGTTPRIVVRSEERDGRVRIWFEDNGIGIRPGHQEKLFGMFQRLTTDVRYEGTGIGLAIVRKAIERMGGAVGVEQGEKAGSRFWVELKKSA